MVNKVGRHAMEAEMVLTTIPNPLEAGRVKAAPEIGKESPQRNVGIVARKHTMRESAGGRRMIPISPDRAKPSTGIDNGRTRSRAPKEREMDRARPS